MATKKKKRTTRKLPSTKKDDILIVGVKKQADLPPAGRKKGSKYEELVKEAKNLEPGQVLEIKIEAGPDAKVTRNRISAAIRRRAQPHTRHRLKICITENGTVGIYCHEARPKTRQRE